jgi:hypothetical protein
MNVGGNKTGEGISDGDIEIEEKEHRFAEIPSAWLRTGSSTLLRMT